MRVRVTGDSAAAIMLRGALSLTGNYVISDRDPHVWIDVRFAPRGNIGLDSADARLPRLIAYQIGALAPDGGVFIHVDGPTLGKGANRDDRRVIIECSGDPDAMHAVETGVRRGLDLYRQRTPTLPPVLPPEPVPVPPPPPIVPVRPVYARVWTWVRSWFRTWGQ